MFRRRNYRVINPFSMFYVPYGGHPTTLARGKAYERRDRWRQRTNQIDRMKCMSDVIALWYFD